MQNELVKPSSVIDLIGPYLAVKGSASYQSIAKCVGIPLCILFVLKSNNT